MPIFFSVAAWGAEVTQPTPRPSGVIEPDPLQWAFEKLDRLDFDRDFLRALVKDYPYDDEKRKSLIFLNLFGFLKKADYTGHYSKSAIQKTTEFLNEHRSIFARAYQQSQVDPRVVAALLWVETKHGKHLGNEPVGAAFLTIIQGEHPSFLPLALDELRAREPNPTPEMIEKTVSRLKDKAAWATEELRAYRRLNKAQGKRVLAWKGSFAGAFGFSQFLPSSYEKWGRSSRKNQPADLYRANDAILSVANYLHKNGWVDEDPASRREALFHYNRAQGYVDVIEKIASEVKWDWKSMPEFKTQKPGTPKKTSSGPTSRSTTQK